MTTGSTTSIAPGLLLLIALGPSACTPDPPRTPPPYPMDEVESVLYLIGDAGAPDPLGEPVLEALRADLRSTPAEKLVVFLGDNLYPAGLPPTGNPFRLEGERILDALLEVFADGDAPGFLIPGNHDWGSGGAEGQRRVQRQAEYILQSAPPGVSVAPPPGCPGPLTADFGAHLRLVMLDTQWWLEDAAALTGTTTPCEPGSRQEALERLEQILAEAGDREVVILAHHPLESGGYHGTRGTWKRHLFPIRDRYPDAWIPLPVIGSLYVLYRTAMPGTQDLSRRPYREFLESINPILERNSPLLWASGHDHDLQVLEGKGARFQVVSGGGVRSKLRPVDSLDGTLFAESTGGYMKIHVLNGGRIRLSVITVDGDGTVREAFALWLTD